MALPRNLALAQQDQNLTRGQVRTRRLIEQVVELVADTGRLQSRRHGFGRNGGSFGCSLCARHQEFPPIAASYSVRGRNTRAVGKAPTLVMESTIRSDDPPIAYGHRREVIQ